MAAEHPDLQVRLEALYLMSQVEDPLATQLLERAAIDEDDPELRMQALAAIVGRPEINAVELLEMAVADPDPLVSGKARELLEQLRETGETGV